MNPKIIVILIFAFAVGVGVWANHDAQAAFTIHN